MLCRDIVVDSQMRKRLKYFHEISKASTTDVAVSQHK